MENQVKPKALTSFEKLDRHMQERIKLEYPFGFADNLISFNDREGNRVSALIFEAEDKIYLIRMTNEIATKLVEEDDDYGDDGILKAEIQENYEEKYQEEDIAAMDEEEE